MKVRTSMLGLSLVLMAATSGQLMAADVPPPPPPPKLEPIPEPMGASLPGADDHEVTVSKRGGDRIEEFRFKGRLYMIRVTPAVGLPYTMVDDRGDGVFNRKDIRGTPMKPAQWNVLTW
ncbi:DUF2782 domain-containing protein [Uliginosibacterium sp. H3]|uniref:DUF2782 domain-containing protein n=1 Tax=Uliginosibacterium silvisoli TaxID=3114758 RepID=A0ABU6JZD6_9RHOO|nr:DUF2782 domain-containing protein [Uliginosibacterium sp. H3]